MKVIVWLLYHTFRNRLIKLLRHPISLLKLVPLLIVPVLLSLFVRQHMAVFSTYLAGVSGTGFAAVVLFLLVFISTGIRAFRNGGKSFSMADVNLLFPAPVPEQKILIYGIVRQSGLPMVMLFALLPASCISGTIVLPALLSGVLLLFMGIFIFNLKTTKDYYEDVLVASAAAYSAIAADKEGMQSEITAGKVKIGQTGIGKGKGPGVFFYKHRLESRRRGMMLLDLPTLIRALMSIVYAFFVRGFGPLPVLAIITFMQITSSSFGRWALELRQPYVYLLPSPPFLKLAALFAESLLQAFFEAAVVMIPVGLIIGATVPKTGILILLRFSFSVASMAGGIAVKRLLSAGGNGKLDMVYNLLGALMIVLPGVIGGIMLGDKDDMLPAMICIITWNIGAAVISTFMCRNILNNTEL